MNAVVVSYPQPYDATAQVAMTVAEQLCRRGCRVELRPVARIEAPSAMPVVLGGATAAGSWDARAVACLRDCGRERSIWLFHTDFGPGSPPHPPSEVTELAARRGITEIPVLADLVAPWAEHRWRPGLPDPALRWADLIADQLTCATRSPGPGHQQSAASGPTRVPDDRPDGGHSAGGRRHQLSHT